MSDAPTPQPNTPRPPAGDKLAISWDDLNDPKVEEKLKERAAVTGTADHYEQAQVPTPTAPTERRFKWLQNAAVLLALFGAVGGAIGWAVVAAPELGRTPEVVEGRELLKGLEEIDREVATGRRTDAEAAASRKQIERDGRHNAYFRAATDAALEPTARAEKLQAAERRDVEQAVWKRLFLLISVAAWAGALLACADALTSRNFAAAVVLALVGVVAGGLGGVAGGFVERELGGGVPAWAAAFEQFRTATSSTTSRLLSDLASFALVGLFVGATAGLAQRSPRRIVIGAVGGLAGGAIGGAAAFGVANGGASAWLPQLIGAVLTGALAGLAGGLIEDAAKSGWVKVTAGLISGKQFILYRNPTYIGSAPLSHIYLFKDPQVGRRHAAIHVLPSGFEIENLPLGGPTLVNGRPVTRAKLRNGDRVTIGRTSFEFHEKPKSHV
jgi:hypothetical protein